MSTLTNKVAYITGGSKGIGYGIAKALLSSKAVSLLKALQQSRTRAANAR